MRSSKFLYTLIVMGIFAVFAFSLFTLTGCGAEKFQLADDQKSPLGIALEDALPEDTAIFLSINTRNKDQREKFYNLMSYFPDEDLNNLVESAVKELNQKNAKSNFSFADDIAPLFSDEFKIVMGLTGDFFANPRGKIAQGKIEKPKGKDTKPENPDFILAFTVADTKKAEELIVKIAEKNPDAAKAKVFDFPALDNKKENMYLALYKDVMIVSNSENKRFEAVKRIRNNEKSLLSNKDYIKAVKSLPKQNLCIVFMDTKKLFEALAKLEDINVAGISSLQSIYFQALAFTAEQDGLKINVGVGMDQKKFNLDKFYSKTPYLYKNIPGENLMLFAEAYDIKSMLEMQIDMLLTEQLDKDNFERIKIIMKGYIGLDLDKDILSWMDRGYAFVIQGTESIIPGISLYIDAKTNPQAAEKTLEVIDSAFEQFVEMLMAEGDPLIEKVLTKKVVKMGKTDDEMHLVSIDFSALTKEELAEANMPEGVFTQPFELYYGLTRDNLFVFSLYTGLQNKWEQKPVEKDAIFKESLTYIKGYPHQLSYLNMEEIIKYAKNFGYIMEAAGGETLPKDMAEAYRKAEIYLSPIKYLVGGNKKVENIAEAVMFIKIEKPAADTEISPKVAE